MEKSAIAIALQNVGTEYTPLHLAASVGYHGRHGHWLLLLGHQRDQQHRLLGTEGFRGRKLVLEGKLLPSPVRDVQGALPLRLGERILQKRGSGRVNIK